MGITDGFSGLFGSLVVIGWGGWVGASWGETWGQKGCFHPAL